MAYSDFALKKVKSDLNVNFIENELVKDTAYIDVDSYYINDIQKIIGILTDMIHQKKDPYER